MLKEPERITDTGLAGVTEDKQMPTVSAEGVPGGESAEDGFWFVAIVKRNTEKESRNKLMSKGFDAYVATQTVMRQYAKRRPKAVELVALPAKVFIRLPHLTSSERTSFLIHYPFVSSFMPDYACKREQSGAWTMAAIPDREIRELRRILGECNDEVTFGDLDNSFVVGGTVKAVFGPMRGYEGTLAQKNGKTYFILQTKFLNCCRVQISPSDVVPV